MRKVLVTGATGEVGQGVLPFLENDFAVRRFALDAPDTNPDWRRGDLLAWDDLRTAMTDIDAVLHLAIAGGHSGTFEDDMFNDQRFDVNVKGAYHVFETARRAQVRRVVYVSSLMVTWGAAVKDGPQVAGDANANPVGTYALTKQLGEEIAQHYATAHDLEILTLRIGAPVAVETLQAGGVVRPQQVPFPDLAQAFAKALTVPFTRYEVVSICGNSVSCPWSLDAARQVLGYEPQFCLDQLGVEFLDPFAVVEQ